MSRLLIVLSASIVAPALAPPAAADATWERPAAPGIVFRMERQESPQRNIYGLRIDPAVVRSESALAGKTVYDLGPLNGRNGVSNIVREQEALGGVNGDFFQFGADPGGDPTNLMVRGGELLSRPGSGARGQAVGWGPNGSFSFGPAAWEASFSVNDGPDRAVHNLNGKAAGGEVTLYTDSAGYGYSASPAEAARVWVGAYRLGPEGELRGTVTEVAPLSGRSRVAPGEVLLVGAGSARGQVAGIRPGDQVRIRVRVTGFDWRRVRDVMGGGPILLREGSPEPGAADSFATTRHPRTAMGRTPEGALWYVVVDGRQEMSVGATLPEMAEIMRRWGCRDAINLDGGGSSTLNLLGLTLNRPSGGTERPVANGILFYGVRPAPGGARLEIRAPEGAVVGRTLQVEVLRDGVAIAAAQVLFTAQGAGWIDGAGRLTPVKEGEVEVAVLVDGAAARIRIPVAAAPPAQRSGMLPEPFRSSITALRPPRKTARSCPRS